MLAGLRTLIQTRDGPDRKVRPPLGNDALSTEPARIGEHGKAIFGNVFVKQDAGLETA
jgi:hypothetical protein